MMLNDAAGEVDAEVAVHGRARPRLSAQAAIHQFADAAGERDRDLAEIGGPPERHLLVQPGQRIVRRVDDMYGGSGHEGKNADAHGNDQPQ